MIDEYLKLLLPMLAVVLLIRGIRKARQPSIESAINLVARKKYKQAEAMLLPLTEQGQVKAMTLLGSAYFLDGQPEKAIEILEKASAKGDLEANTTLAGVFYDGQYVPRDVPRARAYLKPVAESGNVRMQRQYGLWSIVLKDFDEADKWLGAAAGYGDKEAQKDRDHLKDVRAGKVPFVESPPALWDEEMKAVTASSGDASVLRGTPAQESARGELVREITEAVLAHCGSKNKPDYPSVFSCLGSLAGFGCQMAIRDGLIKTGKISERQAFVIIDCADGRKYYFGDLLNRPLAEYPVSVLNLVKEGMKKAGTESQINVAEMARRAAQSISGREYGLLNQPKRYQPREKPFDSLKALWPPLYERIGNFTGGEPPVLNPKETGWLFARAAGELIPQAAAASFSAEAAGDITMEAAVTMSKIEPRLLGYK